nr:LysR substrate-binding domain-containing protein [Burkholderia ubonensis]
MPLPCSFTRARCAAAGDRPCITTVGALDGRPWRFLGAGGRVITLRVQERLRVDSGTLAVAAALRGVGFAIVVEAACRGLIERGELVPIALDKPAAPLELYAAYPQRRHLPATVRAFIDHLTEAAGTLHVARSGR